MLLVGKHFMPSAIARNLYYYEIGHLSDKEHCYVE